MLRILGTVVGGISAFLFCVSILGLVTDPYSEYKQRHQLKSTTDLYQSLDDSYARKGMSEAFIADFLVDFRQTVNYEWPENVDYMPLRVNWLLSVARIADPVVSQYFLNDKKTRLFTKVELPQHEAAMMRGFGICSQLALMGADLLTQRYGVDARVAGLNGHVVMQVFDKTGSWIIDPSFKTYARGDVRSPEKIPARFFAGNDIVKDMYLDKNNNFISSRSGWGGYSRGASTKQEILFSLIIASYYLKWILPVLGMLFGFILYSRGVPRSNTARGAFPGAASLRSR